MAAPSRQHTWSSQLSFGGVDEVDHHERRMKLGLLHKAYSDRRRVAFHPPFYDERPLWYKVFASSGLISIRVTFRR